MLYVFSRTHFATGVSFKDTGCVFKTLFCHFNLIRSSITSPEHWNSGLGGVRYPETHLQVRFMSVNRWFTVVMTSPCVRIPHIARAKL